ncbi:HTH-type transcriptional regulator / antitoxin HigA [Candidatus Magnetomoraceae bacterium gMMP-13]
MQILKEISIDKLYPLSAITNNTEYEKASELKKILIKYIAKIAILIKHYEKYHKSVKDILNIDNLYPLKAINTKEDYEHALNSLEVVFDETEGYLNEYAETLVILIEHYENNHFPMKEADGVEVLNFLMEQNKLEQKDLVEIFETESVFSEIINGNKPLNIKHIKKLANKFCVNAATFVS